MPLKRNSRLGRSLTVHFFFFLFSSCSARTKRAETDSIRQCCSLRRLDRIVGLHFAEFRESKKREIRRSVVSVYGIEEISSYRVERIYEYRNMLTRANGRKRDIYIERRLLITYLLQG